MISWQAELGTKSSSKPWRLRGSRQSLKTKLLRTLLKEATGSRSSTSVLGQLERTGRTNCAAMQLKCVTCEPESHSLECLMHNTYHAEVLFLPRQHRLHQRGHITTYLMLRKCIENQYMDPGYCWGYSAYASTATQLPA